MTEKRIPRESQTRKKEARRTPWKPPSMLEAPEPRRDLSIVGFELGLEARMTKQMFMPSFEKDGNL